MSAHDKSLWSRTDVIEGIAGNKRQHLFSTHSIQNIGVLRLDYLSPIYGVLVRAVQRRDSDGVTTLDVSQRSEKGVPVCGKPDVARLSWNCCPVDVAYSEAQCPIADPLKDHDGHAKTGHFNTPDQASL